MVLLLLRLRLLTKSLVMEDTQVIDTTKLAFGYYNLIFLHGHGHVKEGVGY